MTSPLAAAGGTAATGAAGASATNAPGGIAKVAKQFEAVFLRQMIGSMRQAGLADDLFGSSGEDQFRDMADARLADDMAGKGFGIAELLSRQLGHGDAAATTTTNTTTKAATP